MILVTGASGILGSQIIRKLHTDNKSVRAIKRSTSDISWTKDINDSIEWNETDILDIINLDKAFEGITHVVHCAALISFDNSNDQQMHHVNIEGTKNVLALCEKHHIQKLIYISSVAALGRSSNADIINEDAKWESSNLNTAYANSKYLAELEVWRAQEEPLPKQPSNYEFVADLVVEGAGTFEVLEGNRVKLVGHDSDFRFTRAKDVIGEDTRYSVDVTNQDSGAVHNVVVFAMSETDARDKAVHLVSNRESVNSDQLLAADPKAVK